MDFSRLTLSSTLADLSTYNFEVPGETLGQTVADQFETHAKLPGVIISDQGQISGAFSRQKFLERVGRPFGVEVYLRRPIKIMLQSIEDRPLQLPSSTPIHQAAQVALNRPSTSIYEPIIVMFPSHLRGLLDVYTLLQAQSHLLTLGYQVEQNRRQFAEALQKTGRALSGTLKLQEVTERVLAELASVVHHERGAVLLQTDDRLEIISQRGFPDDERVAEPFVSVGTSRHDVYQRMMRTLQPVLLRDVLAEPNWAHFDWLPLHRSWLGVPLIAQEHAIGMISLTREPANAFTADDASLVLAFAGQAAIALENARLYEHIIQFNDQLEKMVAQRTEELNKAYTILEKLDRTKTDFIKVAAHELRTPLTVVKGYTQVLSITPAIKEDEGTSTMLEGIVSGMNRLHQIVNGMLDVAKIDADNLEVYPEPVRMEQLIDRIYQKFEADLETRQLTLEQEASLAALPVIQADPELLQKVFYSLIINAIKYTPDGGKITVSGKAVTGEGEGTPPAVEVTVSDTGIGIDAEHHELIFEKFYQTGELALHSSGFTKFKGSGPGLGLAIARGIVEAHSGKVWVESPGYNEESCPGSQFHVWLPVA
jgi:signal transduction histidine kinase